VTGSSCDSFKLLPNKPICCRFTKFDRVEFNFVANAYRALRCNCQVLSTRCRRAVDSCDTYRSGVCWWRETTTKCL